MGKAWPNAPYPSNDPAEPGADDDHLHRPVFVDGEVAEFEIGTRIRGLSRPCHAVSVSIPNPIARTGRWRALARRCQ